MKELIELLHQGHYSCVIKNQGEIRTFSERGVTDLYDLVCNNSAFLKGAHVADKVVGKAAASLMIIGGISQLYTDVISLPALSLLQKAHIIVEAKQSVPLIKNRTQTDLCPMEKKSLQAKTADEVFSIIKASIDQIK
ncbi:MAG: DUF1893 domain-containing protein [Bacteroidaceae bacterium]|nr:DUF1893 domain-containing protein [Bacteroidaceae bacterium]